MHMLSPGESARLRGGCLSWLSHLSAPLPDTHPRACGVSVCLFPLSLQLALCALDETCISYILARVLGGLAYLHEDCQLRQPEVVYWRH
jgi:hypothetical protein